MGILDGFLWDTAILLYVDLFLDCDFSPGYILLVLQDWLFHPVLPGQKYYVTLYTGIVFIIATWNTVYYIV